MSPQPNAPCKTNGFVGSFDGVVLDVFFRLKMHVTFYESTEALQGDFDVWLAMLEHPDGAQVMFFER